ncbi:MAG: hypothetical protein IPO92_08330 [Saprospiraceae bacterium]|nr:hypothetical protein [Saprospiraceae bacterium]
MNFLFRNLTGTLKEDNSGANFHYLTNPGSYFTITFPTSESYFSEVGQSFLHTSTASVEPNTWTLKEINPITGNDMATLTTVSGGISFSYSLTMTNTNLRKFKLIADFNGTTKSKTFSVTGFNPVTILSRPSWVQPGINYHVADATKATLVLHAPTYTRYKKGQGLFQELVTQLQKTLYMSSEILITGQFQRHISSIETAMDGMVWLTVTLIMTGEIIGG